MESAPDTLVLSPSPSHLQTHVPPLCHTLYHSTWRWGSGNRSRSTEGAYWGLTVGLPNCFLASYCLSQGDLAGWAAPPPPSPQDGNYSVLAVKEDFTGEVTLELGLRGERSWAAEKGERASRAKGRAQSERGGVGRGAETDPRQQPCKPLQRLRILCRERQELSE